MQERGAAEAAAHRLRLLLALAVVTPLGFATKLYTGPGEPWMRGSAGGVLYEVFWVLAFMLLRPRASAVAVSWAVFLATCALEALQLWKPPFLTAVRGTFLGKALLGDTFVWWDFPYYAVGCVLAILLVRVLLKPVAGDYAREVPTTS